MHRLFLFIDLFKKKPITTQKRKSQTQTYNLEQNISIGPKYFLKETKHDVSMLDR